jgi:hypothetical protein
MQRRLNGPTQAWRSWRQWIVAWQTIDTTMKAIVRRTARGESVVVIDSPVSRIIISQAEMSKPYHRAAQIVRIGGFFGSIRRCDR